MSSFVLYAIQFHGKFHDKKIYKCSLYRINTVCHMTSFWGMKNPLNAEF